MRDFQPREQSRFLLRFDLSNYRFFRGINEPAIITKMGPHCHAAEGIFLLFLSAKAYHFGREEFDEF
jgi:hypothetical protein